MGHVESARRAAPRLSPPWRTLAAWGAVGLIVLASPTLLAILIVHMLSKKPREWDFASEQPAVGTPAPSFVLRDVDGREFRLDPGPRRRPVVLEFGSYT